jgi:hypothetical protein
MANGEWVSASRRLTTHHPSPVTGRKPAMSEAKWLLLMCGSRMCFSLIFAT